LGKGGNGNGGGTGPKIGGFSPCAGEKVGLNGGVKPKSRKGGDFFETKRRVREKKKWEKEKICKKEGGLKATSSSQPPSGVDMNLSRVGKGTSRGKKRGGRTDAKEKKRPEPEDFGEGRAKRREKATLSERALGL